MAADPERFFVPPYRAPGVGRLVARRRHPRLGEVREMLVESSACAPLEASPRSTVAEAGADARRHLAIRPCRIIQDVGEGSSSGGSS